MAKYCHPKKALRFFFFFFTFSVSGWSILRMASFLFTDKVLLPGVKIYCIYSTLCREIYTFGGEI